MSKDTPDYYSLFDTNGELTANGEIVAREEYADSSEHTHILSHPSQLLIGKPHPREKDVRRTQDRKRTKIAAKRTYADHYEEFGVKSSFMGQLPDGRVNAGIRASNVTVSKSYRQALNSKEGTFWKAAVDIKIEHLKEKEVLQQIPRHEIPPEQQTIRTMWVFDLKTEHFGDVVRFWARLVALGNHQRYGIDYVETFSPVARMDTFRLLIAVDISLDFVIYQGGINTAYLNAPLGIKQCLSELEGYPGDSRDMVYVIHKALYGLKQSGREWNTEVNR